MYAVGYFLEVGIGTAPNPQEYVFFVSGLLECCVLTLAPFPCRAISYYKRAAEQGDKRAAQRLKGNTVQVGSGGPGSVLGRSEDDAASGGGGKTKDKDCIIM